MEISVALLFCLSYSIKGGQLGRIPGFKSLRENNGIADNILDGKVLSTLIIFIYFSIGYDIHFSSFCAFAWILGVAPGLGAYFKAIYKEPYQLKEWYYIDRVIEPLKGKPFWWGMSGMALRGVLTLSGFIFLLQSWTLVLFGLFFPICYLIGDLTKIDDGNDGDKWLSEPLTGLVMGIGIALAL